VVAVDEEAAGDEEVVVDVEAVTVVDADSLRAIGVTVARAKGIGGDACHPDGNRSGS
jgi:anti-anti-sigma regulatory factor